ncbi:MAG: nuclear transport factor 2 family protein [Sphingomonadaceae bacterium]
MADPAGNTLEAAFHVLERALLEGDLEGFYGAMLPDAAILDEDLPFRVNTQGFRDHIAFHGPENWEGFAWKPQDVRIVEERNTGIVCGFALFRGKPQDAGYRLRPMLFTQGWTKTASGWRLASWHQSPLVGHLFQPSPG